MADGIVRRDVGDGKLSIQLMGSEAASFSCVELKFHQDFFCATSSSSATMLLVDPGLCSWVCLGDLGANPTQCS